MRRLVFACLIAACAAMTPTWASAGDDEIAQHIVKELTEAQEQGSLKGFDLDLHVEEGTVWLKGTVSNQAQKDLVLAAAQSGQSLGVLQIVEDIAVSGQPTVAAPAQQTASAADSSRRSAAPVRDRQIQPAQHQQAVVAQAPVAAPQAVTPRSSRPLAAAPASYPQAVPVQQAMPVRGPQMQGMGPQMRGMQQAMPMQGGGGMGGPAYLPASASQPAGAYYDQPNMPGYSWPSYASHPNYSAISYPTQYSPTAWPYIGPFYPYPQVPLGWRKVTMEWDDGWWYLDFHDR